MSTDLRQRVEALEPTRSYPYDGGYYDSGYRDAISDVLALLDEQVTRDLEEAGIDTTPRGEA